MPARPHYSMPDFLRDTLNERGLMDAYHARLQYQQNDYTGSLCVKGAKREATKQKRFDQMLDELNRGDVYINT